MSGEIVMLAKRWEKSDPTGWWMSEKLDGVRALWDGKRFLSRNGNAFPVPEAIVKSMPSTKLDGELWIGRGLFQDTISIVRSARDKGWHRVTYQVFDAPEAPGGFEPRIARAMREIEGHAFARALSQIRCEGHEHLAERLAAVLRERGEGLMLRRAGSPYDRRKSPHLLKVKVFESAEARVVGYVPGEGKHEGRVGSLRVTAVGSGKNLPAEGTPFKVGTGLSDDQRERPPKLGALVTYSFQELTMEGVPRFPAFVAVRDYE